MKWTFFLILFSLSLHAFEGAGIYPLKKSTEPTPIAISVSEITPISITMVPNCGNMQLMDEAGNMLASGDGYFGITQSLPAGKYRLVVFSPKGACRINVAKQSKVFGGRTPSLDDGMYRRMPAGGDTVKIETH